MEKKKETENNSEKTPLPLKEYEELQKKEILGPDNEYFAGQELGHSPTDNEAAVHYVEHGGAEHFAKEHLLKNRLEQAEESKEEDDDSDKKESKDDTT
ncbi:MAG: hypothetical protein WC575_01635 [Patescibacteria group bacterium]